MVSLSDVRFGPAYVRPVTRFECDPVDAGEKISDFALSVLAKRRIPPPQSLPRIKLGTSIFCANVPDAFFMRVKVK